MGIEHPLLKRKLEDELTTSGGQKKGSPSLEAFSILAYIILVTLTSQNFVTTPFDEANNDLGVPHPSTT